jgi:hypothetical protein
MVATQEKVAVRISVVTTVFILIVMLVPALTGKNDPALTTSKPPDAREQSSPLIRTQKDDKSPANESKADLIVFVAFEVLALGGIAYLVWYYRNHEWVVPEGTFILYAPLDGFPFMISEHGRAKPVTESASCNSTS